MDLLQKKQLFGDHLLVTKAAAKAAMEAIPIVLSDREQRIVEEISARK